MGFGVRMGRMVSWRNEVMGWLYIPGDGSWPLVRLRNWEGGGLVRLGNGRLNLRNGGDGGWGRIGWVNWVGWLSAFCCY
jgi:hypothetical protein